MHVSRDSRLRTDRRKQSTAPIDWAQSFRSALGGGLLSVPSHVMKIVRKAGHLAWPAFTL